MDQKEPMEQAAAQSAAQGAAQGAVQEADLMTVLRQSHVPAPVCGWLTCLRKPAISVQYSLQKRHIPDLDAAQSNTQSGAQNGAQKNTPNAAQSAAITPGGRNQDTMGVNGDLTIRYFDLLAGMLGLMALGCFLKCCCRLSRHML